MALTTVSNYKTWANIGVTTFDTMLGVILTETEAFVANVLDRRLEDSGSDITEYYDGRGDDTIFLQAYPVTSITSVSYLSGASSGVASYTAFADTEYYATATGRLIRFAALDYAFPNANSDAYQADWPIGQDNIKVVYNGGYTSSTVPPEILLAIYKTMQAIQSGRNGVKEAPTEQDLREIVLNAAGDFARQTT